ncbi:hypothetical protein [Seonamhaeicola sediminis]|nr:hypothetical protein [Seonamhaeicola sediminis]
MKNIKRIVILAALIFFAGKVLFSDFQIVNSKNNIVVSVNK